jgi:hypothetical protein
MGSYALVILLVLFDGTARMAAEPMATLQACEVKRDAQRAEAAKLSIAEFSIECVMLTPGKSV